MNWRGIFQNITSLLPSRSSWRAVLLSIGAATTFWFFNSLNQNYTASINYPIHFEFQQEHYVIINDLPSEVIINVTGGGWTIFRKTFAFNLPSVNIPLGQPADVKKIACAGLLPVINEQLKELRVNYIVTDTLNINVERKKTRKLAVKIDSTAILLESGYRITSKLQATPDSVIVTGPESIINLLPDGLPMAIEENDIDDDFDEFVDFKIRGYSQPLLEISPTEINVQFSVEEFISFTSIVPLRINHFPTGVTLPDSTIEVSILMKNSLRNELVEDSIIVALDFEKIKIDSTILPEIIRYPKLITSVSTDTTAIKIHYE
ncbi:MAG: hypothetical protein OEX22_08010 [Cyclobacteriaceae bacterium]|nr:hypothetical protein [Cyclobacteriaceae bacterium]